MGELFLARLDCSATALALMKRCPNCDLRVPDDAPPYCRVDGAMLVFESGAVGEGAETRVLPAPQGADTSETRILPTGEPLSRPTALTTVLDARPASGNTRELSRPKSRWGIMLAVVALVVVAMSAFYFSRRDATAIESIAIMPFVNQSGNADAEYLSDGMTETLISGLSQLPNLNVKPRSSVFRYKGKEANPQTVAKELNVQAILNGRVVQRGQDMLALCRVD